MPIMDFPVIISVSVQVCDSQGNNILERTVYDKRAISLIDTDMHVLRCRLTVFLYAELSPRTLIGWRNSAPK